MITKEEEKKFEEWFNGNNREPITNYSHEKWGQFIHRGFLECGLIEREPTAKEKWNSFKHQQLTIGVMHYQGKIEDCNLFKGIISLADAAIKEAEEHT
jgi:hypothetical protein